MSKLLFVDDEPSVISGLKRQLYKLLPDCEVMGANSGKEALWLIEKTDFDTSFIRKHAEKYSNEEFIRKMREFIKNNEKTD